MDPYKVLGVSPDASDDEIKKVYRELVKKYHPDKYRDDPAMAPMAEEKIREINAAYDKIQDIRSGKTTYDSGSYGQNNGYYNGGGSGNYGYGFGNNAEQKYARVISFLQNGMIIQAYSSLMSFPEDQRDAEWYYLCGIINEQLGRYSSAYNCYRTAANMDPSNQAFRNKAVQFENITREYSRRAEENTADAGYCISARDCCLCSSICMGPLGGPVFCCW